MKAKEVIKLLKKDGWYRVEGGKGSHQNFEHAVKPGKITVAYHTGDIAPGTLHAIFKQAGWK